MKNLDGKLTLLVNQDETAIDLKDAKSGLFIARVKVNPLDFQKALSRLSDVSCKVQVNDLTSGNFGKELKVKQIKVEIPLGKPSFLERKEFIKDVANKNCPEGWVVNVDYAAAFGYTKYKNGKNYLIFNVTRYE